MKELTAIEALQLYNRLPPPRRHDVDRLLDALNGNESEQRQIMNRILSALGPRVPGGDVRVVQCGHACDQSDAERVDECRQDPTTH